MATFGGGFGASPVANAAPNTNHNPNKDMEVVSPPEDSVSSLNFSPKANFLVATSWDNKVRCWEIASNGTSTPKAEQSYSQPLLCSAWGADGSVVYTGGCDNQVSAWNLATNQSQVVAKHDAPVRQCHFVPSLGSGMLVTASWDKTLRYWDLRQATPAHKQDMSERVYSMDVRHPLLVVGTADRNITVFNLADPSKPYKQLPSPLKFQTRVVTCFPDATGYMVGSIEGRVAVQHVEDAAQGKNFTFKCHRDGTDIYAVNSIVFHPTHGTFVTAGSDGAYNFWDKDSKQRLKAMLKCGVPITDGAYNADGSIYAYSVCYDWSRGHAEHQAANAKSHILLHSPADAEVKAKQRVSRPGR